MRTRAVGTVLALALCMPAAAARADTVLVENAHSGGHFAATNTTSAGGGIYQDVALNTSAGQLVCASAWLRTQLPSTGAAGTFSLYLRGTSAVNAGATSYSGLGNLGNWTQAQTCVEATGSHSLAAHPALPDAGIADDRGGRRQRQRLAGRQRRLRGRQPGPGRPIRAPSPIT